MAALYEGIIKHFKDFASTRENTRAIVSSDRGDSGTAGTGVNVSGAAMITPTIQVRQIYIETAGDFSFTTLDGNPHVIPVADKTWIRPIFVKQIFPASWAVTALRTTATGIHLF